MRFPIPERLKNLTIRQKMFVTLGLTVGGMLLSVLLLLFNFVEVDRQRGIAEGLTRVHNESLLANVAMLKAREYENEFFDRHHDKWLERAEKEVEEVNSRLDAVSAASSGTNVKIREYAERAKALCGQYRDQLRRAAETAKGSNFDVEKYGESREELLDILNEFEPLVTVNIRKITSEGIAAAEKDLKRALARAKIQTVAVLSAIALLLTVLLSITTVRLLASLRSVVERLEDIAQGEGDLSKRIPLRGRDELTELGSWFNVFVDKIQAAIVKVARDAQDVADSAAEVCRSSGEIADGAGRVAGQTNTIAAASEEMAATSSEIANSSHLAAESSQKANQAALAGDGVVMETVSGMRRIAERVRESARTVESLGARSDQIGEIVGTIEDIADQTNLLALNAAIEAARAGEQGRGFAVVADEVRALSERTARATREIGAMIRGIQQETKSAVVAMEEGVAEVEKGSAEAGRSGEALKEILLQIDAVSRQVNQIATAAEDQNVTTNDITQNIQQINEIINTTASTARQSEEASSRLTALAGELKGVVGQFKLAV